MRPTSDLPGKLRLAFASLVMAVVSLVVTMTPGYAAQPNVLPQMPLPAATMPPSVVANPSAATNPSVAAIPSTAAIPSMAANSSASASSAAIPSAVATGPAAPPANEARWVMLGIFGGGGLLCVVVLFIVIGALLRRHQR